MQKLFILSILICSTSFLFAQKKEKDTLKTEEIIVVKPYTPTITDAFKIKSNPSIEETKNIKKEKVTYSIFSIPVASTFTPSKGKAQGIKRVPKERLFQNYVSVGFGNFNNLLFDAYIHSGESRYNDFGVFINHHSSKGGIKNLQLNNNFADTKIDAFYKKFDRDYNWQINAGVQRRLFNYYGLNSAITFNNTMLSTLDEKQVYKNIYVSGNIDFFDSYFQGVTVEVVNFTDNYSSNEIRFLAKPTIEFPVSTEIINANFLVDYISGKFKQEYLTDNKIKYSFLNLGFSPNFEILRDNLTINVGAKLYYTTNLENKKTNFYAYPNITASLKMIENVFILVGGITGDLVQNSYKSYSENNPYVSPTLNIMQTNKQYHAFLGAKGKLASNIGYNFNISHTNEKNKPLFIQNQTQTNGTNSVAEAYQLGNSFSVLYDNIKTIGVFAEVTINTSDNLTFTGNLNYNNYATSNELKAWNLPDITATFSGNYQNKNWFAGAKLFYTGATKDYVLPYLAAPNTGAIIKNNSYIDLNLNGGYLFSDRLTAFAKINNAFGQKYHSFINYQVQTLQVLAGITYKFDL